MSGVGAMPTEHDDGLARDARDARSDARDDTAEPLLVVDDLVKYYPIYGGLLRRKIGDVKAVDGVSFEIKRGEVFGLVGESGCGKSTLGRTLLRAAAGHRGAGAPSRGGRLREDGRRPQAAATPDADHLPGPGRLAQSAHAVSDIIGEGLLAQGDDENRWGDRKVRDKRVEDYLEAVGLRRDYTRRYPHEFSGGQRQRIGIARALALDPEFVVCDEPVSALDVSIQSQILNLLLDLRRRVRPDVPVHRPQPLGRAVHQRPGRGDVPRQAGRDRPMSRSCMPSPCIRTPSPSCPPCPTPDPRIRKQRLVLQGDVPSPAAPPSGCRFHTRCWLRERLGNPENCETEDPPLRDSAMATASPATGPSGRRRRPTRLRPRLAPRRRSPRPRHPGPVPRRPPSPRRRPRGRPPPDAPPDAFG